MLINIQNSFVINSHTHQLSTIKEAFSYLVCMKNMRCNQVITNTNKRVINSCVASQQINVKQNK